MPPRRRRDLSRISSQARQMRLRRRQAQSQRQAVLRNNENSQERIARTQQQAVSSRDYRARLSQEENAQLLENQRLRRANFMQNNWASFNKAAFHYDSSIEYNRHPNVEIGAMNSECRFCKALKWKSETAGMCCSNGKIKLPLIEEPPEPLKSLLSGETEDSKHFLTHTRKYNSCFQMTSFGADKEVHHIGFQPTFIVQGQVYHKIGSLLPASQKEPKFLQIYFIGGNNSNDFHQTDQRCKNIPGVKHNIVTDLQVMLHEHNSLLHEFKTALDNMPNNNYKVVIHADRTPRGQHQGRYNAPLTSEVAVVMTGNDFGTRDIVLTKQDGNLKRVADSHKFYDALQYPLIFWKAQEGYNFAIPQCNPVTGQAIPGKKVSAMSFYAYHLMFRSNDANVILQFRQLLHQFVVDMYVKIESERLRFIQLNQTKLRCESYEHLKDAVATDLNVDPNNLGRMVILPSTFINSPRYLAEYTQDAFAYVRTFGRPDLFITFTTNPTWEEIRKELITGQKQIDRHDLTARVFRQKLMKLMAVLTKGKLFGESAAFMYSIEWQKRGLPHCHILLWLNEKIYPAQIDSLIRAELPNPQEDPILSEIVLKNMVHGPCGDLNPLSPCMKNGKCTKKYPRQLLKETMTNQNGYPLYRRRSLSDGGFTANMKIRSGAEVLIDNKWVVPYSPVLSKMFSAHINVEICSSVQAIKYICKYINKGSDQAVFNVQHNDHRYDEVQNYQSGRFVSSNEAFWRIYSLPLHERHPAVVHLDLHLENGERVYFNRQNLEERLRNPPKTKLTAFFELCQNDNFAKTLLYSEVPKYYTFDSRSKMWKRRVQGSLVQNFPGVKMSDTIGRLYTVDVTKSECYCLRLLLQHVRGPTSFNALKTFNGNVCTTYRAACDLFGLLESDRHWQSTLQEAVLTQSPSKIRQLFAMLISACGLSNPQDLWSQFKDSMSEDILYKYRMQNNNAVMNESIYNEALILIEDCVIAMCGKHLSEFGLLRPQRNVENNVLLSRELNYDTHSLMQYIASAVPKLLPEQRAVYNLVLEKIYNNQDAVVFLDAPGGTGKTFLLNLLLAEVRSRGHIALALASSGIAATLLKGGRTAHSVLKLPLDLSRDESPICNISKNSSRANLLRQSKLLVWDEATMSNKKAIEALNTTLKDVRNDSRLMGGMVVLLAGDFRQTLPVIPRGTPADEVNACLKSSQLWTHIVKMKLTKNMRVHLFNDQEASQFAADLLKIGNGCIRPDLEGKVKLDFCTNVDNIHELINCVFPNVKEMFSIENWLSERAILAPKNEKVNAINALILNEIPGEEKTYSSFDSTCNQDEAMSYPLEFLNSLELSGTPSHKITLKLGVPVMLMRNLDAPRLCNGTRLIITGMGTNIIKAKILTGSFAGEEAIIPRIPIIPTDLPFKFQRLQFPIKLAFAMTINKSQGQTMNVVGISLQDPCFSHGQLYVACSRVSSRKNLYIDVKKTFNVVYKDALS